MACNHRFETKTFFYYHEQAQKCIRLWMNILKIFIWGSILLHMVGNQVLGIHSDVTIELNFRLYFDTILPQIKYNHSCCLT